MLDEQINLCCVKIDSVLNVFFLVCLFFKSSKGSVLSVSVVSDMNIASCTVVT